MRPGGEPWQAKTPVWRRFSTIPLTINTSNNPSAPTWRQSWGFVTIRRKDPHVLAGTGQKTHSAEDAAVFRAEVKSYWEDMALRGFNDDDVWAREALEDAYTAADGWIKERLFKPDMCIVEWRKLASQYHRGIQKLT